MAKISLREAMTDFVGIVLNEVYKRDHVKNADIFKEIMYSAMYDLALEYADRADDVATRAMSLEVDRLRQSVEGLSEENRRLREKEVENG